MVNILAVSELNEQIKSLLESHFTQIFVEGEVSRPVYHTSGHLYFSLKDQKSVIKCVMFRSDLQHLPFRIEDGQNIIVGGRIGIYTPRGEYQLYAKELHPAGEGALQLAFEQLKKRLAQKGYFDQNRKKPIPPFVTSIALVTSKTGAALQDMLRIIQKRWPLVRVYVIDTLVQGKEAASMIARSIEIADALGVDVIVVGRGGGSLEDLWAFNEEEVADAIYHAHTPVVSAVGHEIDFLISDFVADLRAPTPSAAMEMILPDREEILLTLDTMMSRFDDFLNKIIHTKEQQLLYMQKSLQQLSPYKRVEFSLNEIANLKSRLHHLIALKIQQMQSALAPLKLSLDSAIEQVLTRKKGDLAMVKQRLEMAMESKKIPQKTAQVIKDGKPVTLEDLQVADEILLEDFTSRVKAKVLEKEERKAP